MLRHTLLMAAIAAAARASDPASIETTDDGSIVLNVAAGSKVSVSYDGEAPQEVVTKASSVSICFLVNISMKLKASAQTFVPHAMFMAPGEKPPVCVTTEQKCGGRLHSTKRSYFLGVSTFDFQVFLEEQLEVVRLAAAFTSEGLGKRILALEQVCSGIYLYMYSLKNKESGYLSVKHSGVAWPSAARLLAACGPLVRVRVCAVEPMCVAASMCTPLLLQLST